MRVSAYLADEGAYGGLLAYCQLTELNKPPADLLMRIHPLTNLWSMTASLDSQLSVWGAEVLTASLTGVLTEDDLKRALAASGEISRWDQQQPGTDALRKLEDAEKIVSSLAQAALPRRSHIQLADLLRQVAETKRILQSENSE